MERAIILHGTLGSPTGNWFEWLRHELQTRGFSVWAPQLPQPEQPSLRRWLDYVYAECPFEIDENTLIVGHSSGAICATLLAQERLTVGAVIGVSVFCDNSLNWEPNNMLFDVAFDWEKLQTISTKLLFVHSDDDPYVPLDKAAFVARNSGAELMVWPGQGHFNLEKSSSYTSFPRLLEELKVRKYI